MSTEKGMSEKRMQTINRHIGSVHNKFLSDVYKQMIDANEASYAMTVITQNYLQMTMMHLNKFLPQQEAKAVMKVIVDTVMMDYGMHLSISEFNMASA